MSMIEKETKLMEMFAEFPQVEEPLLAAIPGLGKMANPVLRETVLKSATVEQAARLAGVGAGELVTALRKMVGQAVEAASCGGGCAHDYGPARVGVGPEPEWAKTFVVKHAIDADLMLSTGVHPIGKVRECAATLGAGEMVEMRVSFRPEPLLENLRQAGFEVWCGEEGGRFRACFARG
ncbi:MAG: DUF1858 domain-containing protein [Acidobacteria bacterium]|nr:DUF1858 domain-containing protein [Acidobacteriota bacterium]